MNLLNTLLMIFALWRPVFCKNAAFIRAKELAFACLCASGKKTIASMAIFLGRSYKFPIADYKFYSDCKWNVDDLFDPILGLASQLIEEEYVIVAADDTKIHKTGKKIPFAGWQVDPLGPKFQTNLIWALRYLQIAVVLPLYNTSEKVPARSIPVRFVAAPSIKRPGKKPLKQIGKITKYFQRNTTYRQSLLKR
jgi:hypothetical protein